MKHIFHQQLSLAADQLFAARRQLESQDGLPASQQQEQQQQRQPQQQQADAAG